MGALRVAPSDRDNARTIKRPATVVARMFVQCDRSTFYAPTSPGTFSFCSSPVSQADCTAGMILRPGTARLITMRMGDVLVKKRDGWFVVSVFVGILGVASTAFSADCTITLQQNTPQPARSVQVFVNYINAPGEFPGESVDVECQLVVSSVGAVADADASRQLSINAAGTPNAIPAGPRTLATCNFVPSTRFPVAGDFDLSAQSAFDTSFPVPQMIASNITISDISCSGTISTTTTSTTTSSTTTTTTLGPTCGDVDGDGAVRASDALAVLLASIGLQICDDCICDLDGGGSVLASDALRALRVAVGAALSLSCPACGN